MSQFLVHAKHVSNFTATYTDITGRNIHIRTQMAPQFQHEGLAETHDFRIALSARREVGTTFTTTHRQCGKGILEGLFES